MLQYILQSVALTVQPNGKLPTHPMTPISCLCMCVRVRVCVCVVFTVAQWPVHTCAFYRTSSRLLSLTSVSAMNALTSNSFIQHIFTFYPRDVVSAVYMLRRRGWLVSVCHTAGIVSKRLNVSLNFFYLLLAPSFKPLWPLAPIHNSKGSTGR